MRNPLSLEALADWLKRQPQDEPYSYFDNCGCMLFQYFTEVGLRPTWMGALTWIDADGNRRDLSDEMIDISCKQPRTFGAALERTRAYSALASAE